jgi:hypothetical protein
MDQSVIGCGVPHLGKSREHPRFLDGQFNVYELHTEKIRASLDRFRAVTIQVEPSSWRAKRSHPCLRRAAPSEKPAISAR